MKNNDLWLTWDKLDRISFDKELILFGSGEWAEKTIRKINRKPLYILDNSQIMQNTVFCGTKIVSPNCLKDIKKRYIILITTGSYKSVIKQLESMGFKQAEDYFCSPVLLNQKIEYDIKNNNQTILLTCPQIPDYDSPNSGGGIYTFNTKTRNLIKQVTGKFHQIVQHESYYFIVDEFDGVAVFDLELNKIESFKGLPGSIMHGLAYNPNGNILYVANTGRDSISVMDAKNGKHIDEIFISGKDLENDADRHHINDLCFYKNDLFVSMFSFSGLWREGCYDGGIAKLDLRTEKIVSYPIKGLWMPHSIEFINGEIVVVDSMRGDVYKTNNKKLVNINGFARGITYDGKYYYIAQSEHRYFDRLKDASRNIHINCGIHVYDDINKASRFYSFENMTNIHSLTLKKF